MGFHQDSQACHLYPKRLQKTGLSIVRSVNLLSLEPCFCRQSHHYPRIHELYPKKYI